MASSAGPSSTAGGSDVVSSGPKPMSADALAGKATFTSLCTACHNANEDRLVGPGLKGVRQRTPGDAWLVKWIRNSSAVVASGDPYATKIFNDYGKIQMSSFTNLTDLQIKQVLDYIDAAN
ncbi:cytochrome c [Fibrella sp. HMF5335]|uniref:Cytochrome c n=2 Tax=Fibrella rubiginis TaxID=2817060 RepID=A0A939JZS2_9BACT|nr:cytochrome c [Fibrella rubiginis]